MLQGISNIFVSIRSITPAQRAVRQKHEMPEHLKKVETAKNPRLSDIVMYNYHKAAQIMEKDLVKEMDQYAHFKPAEKQARVTAILNLIGNVTSSLEVSFPIIKNNGSYEIITGYRAHHVRHRLPLKGGMYRA